MGNQLKDAYQTQRGSWGEGAVTGVRHFKSVRFATLGFPSPVQLRQDKRGIAGQLVIVQPP